MIERRPPRARPLALAGLAMALGLVAGLGPRGGDLLAAAVLIGIVAVGVGWIGRSGRLRGLALLWIVAVAGLAIGDAERRESRRDCRRSFESGESVRVVGLALTYLPAGERGTAAVRPIGAPAGHRCVWVGALRLWAIGPIHPGEAYLLSGGWRPARHEGLRSPARSGWLVVGRPDDWSGEAGFHPFLRARAALAERLWRIYPRRWAPLAEALVLGQRETVDPESYQRLAHSGLAHLLAISGLHVGLLAGALLAAARTARFRPEMARIGTVALVLAYVTLIGMPASAVRAALMIAFWSLARLAGRPSSPFDLLGLAAMVLLLADPWQVIEPGFQLSFSGAAAVVYAGGETRAWSGLQTRHVVLRGLVTGIFVSAATTLLTAPVTLYHFGRVAPAAVLGNLVAIPLLGLAMPALFLSAMASAWPALAAWPASAGVMVLVGIDALAGVLSEARWSSVELANPGPLPVLAYIVLLSLAAQALRGAWQRRRFILGLGLAFAVSLLWAPVQSRLTPPRLQVHVIDVGQGEAIAIRTPGRRWMLYDAGPNAGGFDAGQRRVVPFLRSRGVRRLDAMLISHPDLDHVGGGPAVLEAVQVSRVIGPGDITGQSGQLAVLERMVTREIGWLRAVRGGELVLDGVRLEFLHPGDRRLDEALGTAAPNDRSLVFLLRHGRFTMLFTGDISGVVEDRLAAEQLPALRAAVLKVAHHGSGSSTTERFLAAVDPRLAVISAGLGNRYGHPAPEVMKRLEDRSIEVWRTDRDGTLTIEADTAGSWRIRSTAEGF